MLNPITRYRFKSPLLTLLVRAIDWTGYLFVRHQAFRKDHIKKILVIRLDDLGDVILATPAIRNIQENFPDAAIDILVKSSTKDIVLNNPHINKIWVLDPFWMRSKKPFTFKQMIHFVQQLRRENYDLALELRGNPFNIILAFLCRSRYRAGYGAQGLGFLLTCVIAYADGVKHEIERNLDLLRGLDLSVSSHHPELFIPDAADRFVDRFLKENTVSKGDMLVCIHPGAPWQARRWPQERFAALADALIAAYKSKIVLIGSGDEKALCSAIRNLAGPENRNQIISAAGAMDIAATAALIRRCRLFIGNDSGPMHIASAVNTDTVALFGPQTPELFGPRGAQAAAIYRKVDCSPCIQKGGRGCMRGLQCCEGLLHITADDVMDVIEKKFTKLRQ
jgi:predicted lipopolysaccharide heptosyltransferase III